MVPRFEYSYVCEDLTEETEDCEQSMVNVFPATPQNNCYVIKSLVKGLCYKNKMKDKFRLMGSPYF